MSQVIVAGALINFNLVVSNSDSDHSGADFKIMGGPGTWKQ